MDHLKGLIMIGDGMCISQCENLRIFLLLTQILYEIISELTLRTRHHVKKHHFD